jgi:hypothetical protein
MNSLAAKANNLIKRSAPHASGTDVGILAFLTFDVILGATVSKERHGPAGYTVNISRSKKPHALLKRACIAKAGAAPALARCSHLSSRSGGGGRTGPTSGSNGNEAAVVTMGAGGGRLLVQPGNHILCPAGLK